MVGSPPRPLKQTEHPRDRVVGVMFDRPASAQIWSIWFGCVRPWGATTVLNWGPLVFFRAVVFFLCVYMARINYLIQTIFSQLLFYLNDVGLARSITTTFTILLPLGGIVGERRYMEWDH